MDRDSRKRHQQKKIQSAYPKAYIENVKQFLAIFKTSLCNVDYEHDFNTCQFHHGSDMRRNPYLEHTFAYYPNIELFQQAHPSSNPTEDMICRNKIQLLYHPIIYKTQRCMNFYNCPLQLVCPHFHNEDQKYFEYGEFFRFDIQTHKTKPCPRRGIYSIIPDFHQRKTCIYLHNETDRRRPNFDAYSHQLCVKNKCDGADCHYSHNKIEQVYHPSRYKSKFCKTYTNKNVRCDYKQFCAFAHTQVEIKIQMIHLLNRDHDFYLQKYKTVWCPDTQTHDRSVCVYAHNIQDFRRNPFKYMYQPQKCSFWNFQDELKSLQDSGCKAGMNCDKCHGWMEQRYHPQSLKKNKQNQLKQANLMIEKKIVNVQKDRKQSKDKVSRISLVVQQKVSQIAKVQNNGIRDVGAPFFKKQANSESSRKTKALTTNFESDDSAREQTNNVSQQNDILQPHTRKKSMFFLSQDDIWRSSPIQGNNWIQKKLDEGRARSQNKFDDCETVYSHSLKEAVGDNSILRKLKNNNINELKLKNLSQSQISELKFLDKQQRDQLNNKIKLYQLRRERNPIIYNLELTKFFINKNRQSLLQKTKEKKIKEDKLLCMKAKDLQKIDFLSQTHKQQLLILIGQYKKFRNQQQFSQINEEIFRFVSPKRTPHQS